MFVQIQNIIYLVSVIMYDNHISTTITQFNIGIVKYACLTIIQMRVLFVFQF